MELNTTLSSNLLDTLPFQMAILDASGVILQTNRAWKSFGSDQQHHRLTPARQGVGDDFLDACRSGDDEYATRAARGLERILEDETQTFSMEYPCHTPNRQQWLLLRLSRFEFEQSVYLVLIQFDITDRKQTERKSRELADIVEHLPIGLITYASDDEGASLVLKNLNPAAGDTLNPTGEIAGRDISTIFPGAEENGLLKVMQTVLESGDPREIDEYQPSIPHLKERIWTLRVFPLHENRGGVAFEDVTTSVQNRKRLRHLATHDELTGVMSRELFMKYLKKELNRTKRYGSTFCLMILDLDHFKRINDRYGHLAGDQVLERVGSTLKNNLREADLAGRYGGEEFVILLPETQLTDARAISERLRRLIGKGQYEHDGSTFKVTCSIGLSSVNEQDRSPDDVIDRADKALYRAKEEGRDRVVVAYG